MRTIYSLTDEPRGSVYHRLLFFCSQYATEGLVVVRDPRRLEGSAQSTIQNLQQLGGRSSQVAEWPGTRLTRGGQAYVYRFPFSEQVLNLLTSRVDGLYEWRDPDQPEDLCLIRSDGQDVLASISHERDGYLTLTEAEFNALQNDEILAKGLAIKADEGQSLP